MYTRNMLYSEQYKQPILNGFEFSVSNDYNFAYLRYSNKTSIPENHIEYKFNDIMR